MLPRLRSHSWFWPRPNNREFLAYAGELKAAIDASFGSLDELKSKFNAAAAGRFGSGWAWVSRDEAGKLVVSSTPNQDNPLFSTAETPGIPILGLDVWEHAYYLKYHNRRPECELDSQCSLLRDYVQCLSIMSSAHVLCPVESCPPGYSVEEV